MSSGLRGLILEPTGNASSATRLADSYMERTLMRFRLGAHGQAITAAWAKFGHVKRADRLCRCCSMQVVEDELHMVFECPLDDEVHLGFPSCSEPGVYTSVLIMASN